MTWRRLVPIGLLLLGGCGGGADEGLSYFPNVGVYEASPEQARVDHSFSPFAIETPFAEVKDRLTVIPCEHLSECEWRDADGVRHYFFDENLVVKRIDVADFGGRPIPALGIGVARRRGQVLEAARRFLPAADFDCHEYDERTESCSAMLHPGWVAIRFSDDGLLTEVQLDGYHFT